VSGAVHHVDFQALIPIDFESGLRIDIGRGTQLDGQGSFFTAAIAKRRFNDYGRELKAKHVITICGKSDDSLPTLLDVLARLFEQSDVAVTEPTSDGTP
jgi:hypothetical protein